MHHCHDLLHAGVDTPKRKPFHTEAHMAWHRMGARGNTTSFPLPWSDLLAELVRLDDRTDAEHSPDLPWAGEQLADKISILLKTRGDDAASMAQFIHQALVRRAPCITARWHSRAL